MPLFTRNIDLGPALRLPSWRKIAIGTWRDAGDPSVFCVLEVDMRPALAYLERIRASTGTKVTLTHFVGKAVAVTLALHPQLNCILRFGRLYPRKDVDVFFQVATDTLGKDLSGLTIRRADTKSIPEIALEMQSCAERIRKQGDPEFKRMKSTMGGLPGWASRFVLGFAGFVLYTLNLWTPLLGSPRDPFGSCMITSIGTLGLDMAFAPLVPFSRVPLLIAVGAARDTPVARDGRVEIAPVSRLCVTIDHRLIDGMLGSHMARALLEIFADPERAFGPVQGP
jgi:pyruvate/2-oxoglutarate dehydrogenase complex dihydrolipoamide acyltransferase (E2) component